MSCETEAVMKTREGAVALSDSVSGSDWLEIVRRHVDTLDFGVVQIVVHGSRVVQIERTEKVRLQQRPVADSERGP